MAESQDILAFRSPTLFLNCDPFSELPTLFLNWMTTDGIPGATTTMFSRDGKRLLTAGPYAMIWDVAKLDQLVKQVRPGDGWIQDACFCGSDYRLLVAGRGSASGVWDAETGKQILTLGKRNTPDVPLVACSPDGTIVADCFPGVGHLEVWKLPPTAR